MPFWYTFSNLISMNKKSTLFRCTFLSNFDGKLMKIRGVDFDLFLKEKIVEVLISVFKKFSIYQKLKPFELHIWTSFCFDVLIQNSSVPTWNVLDDHIGFKNICTSWYLTWSYLLAFTGFLNQYCLKYFLKSLGETSIFSKVEASENICWVFLWWSFLWK